MHKIKNKARFFLKSHLWRLTTSAGDGKKDWRLTLKQGETVFFEELESLAVLHFVEVIYVIFTSFSLCLI